MDSLVRLPIYDNVDNIYSLNFVGAYLEFREKLNQIYRTFFSFNDDASVTNISYIVNYVDKDDREYLEKLLSKFAILIYEYDDVSNNALISKMKQYQGVGKQLYKFIWYKKTYDKNQYLLDNVVKCIIYIKSVLDISDREIKSGTKSTKVIFDFKYNNTTYHCSTLEQSFDILAICLYNLCEIKKIFC